jgi:hypothetical protein
MMLDDPQTQLHDWDFLQPKLQVLSALPPVVPVSLAVR